jgi:AcrR family transcriptional regulator
LELSDTRTRIIAAARTLFIRHGFRGATTKLIAQEAGVAEMTLFRHFPTKEKIFEEVVDPLIRSVDDFEVDAGSDLKEVIRHLLEHRLQFLRTDHDIVRLVLNENDRIPGGFNPIKKTAAKIRAYFELVDPERADTYLRLIMGFILTCIFLPEECDGSPPHLDQLLDMLPP